MIRLYEEPYVELGQPMLVDEMGRFLPGFDDSVPLAGGYRDLIDGIALMAYRNDLAAAYELEGHYLDDEKPRLALRYWQLRAAVTLEAFDDLQEYDIDGIGPEAVHLAVQILESWERRLAEDDADGHDKLSDAWTAVASLAEDHAKDLVETSGERAVQAARSAKAKGSACLFSSLRLWVRALQDGASGRSLIRRGTADPRARLVELIETAERELILAAQWPLLLSCFAHQIEVDRNIRRYERAVRALANAFKLLASGQVDDGSMVWQNVVDLCLTLGQIHAAVRVGARQEQWMHSLGLVCLLQLHWHGLAASIAANPKADIHEDQRAIALLAEANASNDTRKASQIARQLDGVTQIHLILVSQILGGHSDREMPGLDKVIETHPQLVPLHSIWARLFRKPHDISDTEVLAYIHRYDDTAQLLGVWACLMEAPAQATRALRRQLSQAVSMDARIRCLMFYGLHAAFLHNSDVARQCGALLAKVIARAPEAAVIARNSDPLLLARAGLRQLADQGRIDSERRALLDELWQIIEAPRAPSEPQTLAWTWQDGLPIEAMRQAAVLLEHLPEDFEELIATPLTRAGLAGYPAPGQ